MYVTIVNTSDWLSFLSSIGIAKRMNNYILNFFEMMAALNRWYILHHYKHKKNSPSDI